MAGQDDAQGSTCGDQGSGDRGQPLIPGATGFGWLVPLPQQCCHPTLANSDAYDVALANESCGQDVGGLSETPDRAGRLPGLDLKPHGNDRLGDGP